MTKSIEDYPELEEWLNKHHADTEYLVKEFHFAFEVQDVELKLLDLQATIDAQQERISELEGGFDPISELILDCFGKRPVPCDGMLYVPSHKYNKLARKLNELNKESK